MHCAARQLAERQAIVKAADEQHGTALTALAQGNLAPEQRRLLAQRALRDPQFAAELKLALRLADSSGELARDWVAVAARAPAQAHGEWWRPFAGVAASLAIIAAVLSMPRNPQVDAPATVAMAQVQSTLPDRIGEASFEAPELFGGSFEAD